MIALSANEVMIHMKEKPAPLMWLAGFSFDKMVYMWDTTKTL